MDRTCELESQVSSISSHHETIVRARAWVQVRDARSNQIGISTFNHAPPHAVLIPNPNFSIKLKEPN